MPQPFDSVQPVQDKADQDADSKPIPLYNDEMMKGFNPQSDGTVLIHDLTIIDARENQEPLKKGFAGETTEETIRIGDQDRSYRLHVPKNYDPSKPTALMLVYHGMSDPKDPGDHGAVGIEKVAGLNEKSDSHNFIVAYLQGNENKDNAWNNGQRAFSKRDDIGFTKGVIDELSGNLNVDRSRVFAVGFSQGESFVHHAANDPRMRGQFAAIGVVGGWLPENERLHPDKGNAQADDISMISIKSGNDKTVPYEGRFDWPIPIVGDILRANAGMRSEPEEFEWYRKRNDIKTPNERTDIYDVDDWKPGQEPRHLAAEHTATNGKGATITSVKVDGLGHVWPGGVGGESKYSATDRLLEFFKLQR
ncbi:MAG: hypothetical protein SGJ27_04800 [Candidatus Melainabacteria bacterium]|nr:hypothetical protein [Candidatus Melainabacteria bacterium]